MVNIWSTVVRQKEKKNTSVFWQPFFCVDIMLKKLLIDSHENNCQVISNENKGHLLRNEDVVFH